MEYAGNEQELPSTDALFKDALAKSEKIHQWEVKMRMEMEAREREVKDGQRVLALINEQLKAKTQEYDILERDFNQAKMENEELVRNRAHLERLSSCLEADVRNLQSIMNVQEQSVSLLEQVQEQAESDLVAIRSAFERLQIVKEAEKNELEEQVKMKDEQMRSMQEEWNCNELNLKKDLMSLSDDCVQKARDIEALQAALEEKSREIESLCQSSDQIKTNLDSKEAEVSRLSSMLEERDSKLHQQTKELSGIKTQLETVIVEGNALAKEKDAFTERYNELEINLKALELEDKSKTEQLHSLTRQLDASRLIEIELRANIAAAEASVTELNQQMDLLAEKNQTSIDKYRQEIVVLQTLHDDLKAEIARLDQENVDAKTLIKDLENRRSEAEKSYQSLIQSKACGDEEIAKTHLVIQVLKAELEEAQDSLQKVNQQFNVTLEEIEILIKRNEASKTEIKKNEEEKACLSHKLDQANQNLTDFKQANQSQCQKISQLSSEIEAAKKIASDLKEKITECGKLKQQNSNLEKKMADKNKEFETYKKESATREELTNQLQTELENLRQEIAQAYEENSSLTQKMSSLEVASLEAGNNFTLTKQAYESQCQKIGQLTSEVEASKKDKITECSKLKEQISGLEKKMTEKNKEMDAFMKYQHDHLLPELEFMKESLVSAEERVRALQIENEELTGLTCKVQALESELVTAETEKEKIFVEMRLHNEEVEKAHRDSVQKLTSDLEAYKKMHNSAADYINKMDIENQDLKRQLMAKTVPVPVTGASKVTPQRPLPPPSKATAMACPAASQIPAMSPKAPIKRVSLKSLTANLAEASESEDDIFALPKRDDPYIPRTYVSKRKSGEFGASQTTPKAGPSGTQPGATNPSASAATDLKGKRILVVEKPSSYGANRKATPSRATPIIRGRRFADEKD